MHDGDDSKRKVEASEEDCHQQNHLVNQLDQSRGDSVVVFHHEEEHDMVEGSDGSGCGSNSNGQQPSLAQPDGDLLPWPKIDAPSFTRSPSLPPRTRRTSDRRSLTLPSATSSFVSGDHVVRPHHQSDQHPSKLAATPRTKSLFAHNHHHNIPISAIPQQAAPGHGKSFSSSSSHSASSVFVPPQSHQSNNNGNTLGSSSLSSSWLSWQGWSPEAILASKEKELAIQQSKLLALSTLAESVATNSSHQARQAGFYGKQLKLVGKIAPSGRAADFEMIVKLHVIENQLTSCPLLPSSTVLQRWVVLEQHLKPIESEAFEADSMALDTTTEKSTPSSVPATNLERTNSRRQSLSSRGSSLRNNNSNNLPSPSAETHVATMPNALCFITNRAGEYLVKLWIRVPFVPSTSPDDDSPEAPQRVHLSLIPKCRSNFLLFKVEPSSLTSTITSNVTALTASPKSANATRRQYDSNNDIGDDGRISLSDDEADLDPDTRNERVKYSSATAVDFKIHPSIVSLDEADLNPASDEDVQFWLEARELVAQDQVVEKLLDIPVDVVSVGDHCDRPRKENVAENEDKSCLHSGDRIQRQVAGCFPPSSTLHISWMPKHASQFVTSVRQEVHANLTVALAEEFSMGNFRTTSLLVGQKRRQNPEEDVQLLVSSDDDESEDSQYTTEGLGGGLMPAGAPSGEHVRLDLESHCVLNVRKLGWKSPFVDVQIFGLPASTRATLLSDRLQQYGRVLQISGEAVQDWRILNPVSSFSVLDQEEDQLDPVVRISFFSGTEAQTEVHIILHVDQLPPTHTSRAGDDLLTVPKINFIGSVCEEPGRVRIVAGEGLLLRPSGSLWRSIGLDEWSWPLGSSLMPPSSGGPALEGSILQYHYPDAAIDDSYEETHPLLLSVYARQYQSMGRIERIERVHVNLGLSELSKPAYVRVRLEDVVVNGKEGTGGFLRVLNLEGVEVWGVRVNGLPCTRTMEAIDTDKRRGGGRLILIPLPLQNNGDSRLERGDVRARTPDGYEVEFSYGFKPRFLSDIARQEGPTGTADTTITTILRDLGGDAQQDEEQGVQALHIVLPGFDLPVGEYLVAAQLPQLPSSMTYGEPLGEFRSLLPSSSSVAVPRQQPLHGFLSAVTSMSTLRATLFGVFMSSGQPELKIPVIPVSVSAAVAAAAASDSLGASQRHDHPQAHQKHPHYHQVSNTQSSSDAGPATSTSTTSGSGTAMHAHDPQQPPPGVQHLRRTLFHSHQRHPQAANSLVASSSSNHLHRPLPGGQEYDQDDEGEDETLITSTPTASLQAPSIIRPGDPLATTSSDNFFSLTANVATMSTEKTTATEAAAQAEGINRRATASTARQLREREGRHHQTQESKVNSLPSSSPRIWWRHIVVLLVSIFMVLLLHNAVSFQESGLSPFFSWSTASFGHLMERISCWRSGRSIQNEPWPRGIEGTLRQVATAAAAEGGGGGVTATTMTLATTTTLVATKEDESALGEKREEKIKNVEEEELTTRVNPVTHHQAEHKDGISRESSFPLSTASQQEQREERREPGLVGKARRVLQRALDNTARWWRLALRALVATKRIEAGPGERGPSHGTHHHQQHQGWWGAVVHRVRR